MKLPCVVAVAAMPLALCALDLSDKSDIRFAEEYAFSTNRAELIATLPPDSKAWFTYSILNAETEGRFKDAHDLVSDWTRYSHVPDRYDGETYADLLARITFHEWNDKSVRDAPSSHYMRYTLKRCCGIDIGPRERQTPLAPNTYPSSLDPSQITFASFWTRSPHFRSGTLSDKFKFLPLIGEKECEDKERFTLPTSEDFLYDLPGYLDAALANCAKNDVFPPACLKGLPLDAVERAADALKGTANDLRGSDFYAKEVLAKLTAGADDDPNDYAAAVDIAKRRLAFADTLLPSLANVRRAEYLSYLKLRGAHGEWSAAIDEFTTYLGLRHEEMRHPPQGLRLSSGDVIADYISAFRSRGVDLAPFRDKIEKKAFERICAEADLLNGRPVEEIGADAITPAQYKELQERVELNWAKTNPSVFAADADVSLALDVKNVKKLRLSIYELDPFAACRILDGEVKSDIDLDAAVPKSSKTFDYSSVPQIVRHSEKFDLPELKKPGLYVVECSGSGMSSRALVRKGRLRVTERRVASGHVFTAIDESGNVVKNTRLRLGETVFAADEDGEIAVPFAPDGKSAGKKTAVVTDGRLASTIAFDHVEEKLSLGLGCVLPVECLVAGRKATALLLPRLRISGEAAPISLLENPRITLKFVDQDGHCNVQDVNGVALRDDEESVVSFTVPERLSSVEFTIGGTVKRAVTGKDEALWASAWRRVNLICSTDAIGQAFMRRGTSGWRIELRGRTGEPLSSRAVAVSLRHKAFREPKNITLQADAQGAIDLGRLPDIDRVSFEFDGHRYSFDTSDDAADLPSSLSAAEGEMFEIPVRGLFAGEWPGAKRLAVRVSLLSLNKAGKVTGNYVSACSYTNGVLRVAGLPSGDYKLTLRDRAKACRLYVAKAGKNPVAGGVVAGLSRSLTDTGAPSLLRIESAAVSKDGKLSVHLANATPETRVHVFATRMRSESVEEDLPSRQFASLLERRGVSVGTWGGRPTDYVSGRDLGDKLRYVLDRRDQPKRVGNMLFRPSLLLTPWSTTETDTKDVTMREGADWQDAADALPAMAMEGGDDAFWSAGFGGNAMRGGYGFRDFLPQAATVVANARPDAKGVVEVDLAHVGEVGLSAQDVTVLATDGEALDHVSLFGAIAPFTPRNLGHVNVVDGKSSVLVKNYNTIGELFMLLRTLNPAAPLGTFDFLATWNEKTHEEKCELYGEYASHELDFFLHEKDPAFFEKVVLPNLRNKRTRRFVDKCLLGEDVSEWKAPGRLDELNAFEQCLLARVDKSVAAVIARRMSDWCDAHPSDPDRGLDEALGTMMKKEGKPDFSDDAPVSEMACAPAAEAMDMSAAGAMDRNQVMGSVKSRWSNQRAMVPSAGNRYLSMRGARKISADKRKETARREGRQLYRPPERTREWVETYYWKTRQDADTSSRVTVNEFWRDWAKAIAEGREGEFVSDSVRFVGGADSITSAMAALAATKLPFAAEEGRTLVFKRTAPQRVEGARATVVVTQRFRDPQAERKDGTTGAEVSEEFVRGHVYELVTVLTNPTDENRRVNVFTQVPSGAIALRGAKEANGKTVQLRPYSIVSHVTPFYFPKAAKGVGVLAPATAAERNGFVAAAQKFACNVVETSTKTDVSSWAYISQNGTGDEVLTYLREKNLFADSVSLPMIAWRMRDGAYSRKVLDELSSRNVFCWELWLAGLQWPDAYDEARVREALMRSEFRTKLTRRLGTMEGSRLVTLDAEDGGAFEHREYWPIINARVHTLGGSATIANEGLKQEYRAFLDVLAQKRSATARDHVLASVYLLAQDRVDEAKAHVRMASAGTLADDETRMQRDYLDAYLAFCDGDVSKGREIAVRYVDWPVPLWRRRFRDVVAQADEVLGNEKGSGEESAQTAADLAPAIAASAVTDGEGAVKVSLSTRNLTSCTLKAYPMDIEIAFSKDPFGTAAKGRDVVRCLKPAWSRDVALTGDETQVALPKELSTCNLVIVADGADGRAEARLELTPCAFVVQVVREYRQLRVKGRDGKPIAGAYVKVYAKGAGGSEVQFHKDGYTDLRGAFDYASVSTDSNFKPTEFAILVLPEGLGASIQRVE